MEDLSRIVEAEQQPVTLTEVLDDLDAPLLKMWTVVRRDLKMPEGKLVTQSGHAYLDCGLQADKTVMAEYQVTSKAKIALRVKSEAQLLRALALCEKAGLNTVLVTDAGKTVFGGIPTNTMFAVGPCFRHELPRRVDALPML